jgi:hypothetical protein
MSLCTLGRKLLECQLILNEGEMLPFITADHFRFFLDGTGKPLAQFMDSVSRANTARLGILAADVNRNLRVHVHDGGIHGQIDRGDDPGLAHS